VYFVLAMTLFFDDAYEEVMRKLVDGLRFLRSWDEDWQVPSASALCQARALRVIEHDIANRETDGGSPTRLITTILDPEMAAAGELAAVYHRRWEFESSLAEIETRQRGS
jgi:hypothetical protein